MYPSGDGGGGLTATGLVCDSCGAQPSPTAKFCSECGARRTETSQAAEYKQVTVLFADVVHSMDIATTVGAERLREIMTELVDRTTKVVKRYGGTVDKFTGDGIMAVFGAPVALEDHAVRGCLAALDIHTEAQRLASEVEHRDDITLRLRVGLNSGEVIAGETGSGPWEKARLGDLDGAIGLSRAVVDELFESGGSVWSALAASVLVESLLRRGRAKDVRDAQDAIDRLAAVPTDPGFVLHEIWLLRLRALLAQAHGDEAVYREFRDRYRAMAKTLGFEGHIAWAEAMP